MNVQEAPLESLPPPPPPAPPGRTPGWWVPGAITILTIGAVIVVTIWQLHASLLVTNTTTTGGDTGAHIAMPKYLEYLLSHGHITGWDPGWYDGFPLYTFYFTIPDLFIAVGGWIIPYDIAFKLGTILGSVTLPVCAWACGRFFRLRPPIPTIMAAATLPFLFDYTFTIYGGNLFSTLAGEYAYSFSLSLAVLFVGLFACAVREGRHRGWAAVVLAACVLSHIVGGMYALGGAAIITVIELLPARWGIRDDGILRIGGSGPIFPKIPKWRTLWWAVSTVLIGILLTGFWLGPFGLEHAYSISMGYTNVEGWALYFREADTWALVLAGLGAITAVLVRSRFGIAITLLGIASGVATAIDPQGSLYNVRLLPLWFLSVYLMAAWAFGTGCVAVAMWWRRLRLRRWERAIALPQPIADVPLDPAAAEPAAVLVAEDSGPDPLEPPPLPEPAYEPLIDLLTPHRQPKPHWKPAAVSGAILGLLGALLVVVPPFVSWMVRDIPGVHTGPNEVANWSQYNYTGYEGQSSYPEYRSIMLTMESVAKKYGCGRAMWEYSSSENRFGTPEALMLLPYWTNGCIDSMEGLLFESSATTPYHFLNQAELSEGPSEPEVGLPYGPLDVPLGVQHLQLLGVKYFMAETPTVEAEANSDPSLKLVAKTGPWAYNYDGVNTHTTWNIYVVRQSTLVTPLHNEPVVLSGVKPGPSGPSNWLTPSIAWYDDPSRWHVELAQSGPTTWPRTSVNHITPTVKHVPATTVSGITTTNSTIDFHVSRVGTPVLVKVSYFPNWHASGAQGPYRVSPNLMVVVPTSHDVRLTYGATSANYLGLISTVIGLLGLVGIFAWPRLRSRRSASSPDHGASS
jgi:hypothetical protein